MNEYNEKFDKMPVLSIKMPKEENEILQAYRETLNNNCELAKIIDNYNKNLVVPNPEDNVVWKQVRHDLAVKFVSFFPNTNKNFEMSDGAIMNGIELTEHYLQQGGVEADMILNALEKKMKESGIIPVEKEKPSPKVYHDGLNRHQRRAQAARRGKK